MPDDPLVSVFIRVRDEARALRDVLEALTTQCFDGEVEVVVLDNESCDDSGAVALQSGARVFSLPRELFGYGRALNLGVELCRGRFIVMLSAHAIPQTQDWLSLLVAPMRADPSVGAVFCRQIPNRPVGRLERQRFDCFPDSSLMIDSAGFIEGCHSGSDPYGLAIFSNSASALSREAALANPFRDLLYAEDRAFAVDHLVAGGKVAYIHEAVVAYDRRVTWKSAYHVARRAQVSKRLIRELAATYTGRRFGSAMDTADRLLRAAAVVPGLLVRLVAVLREPMGLRSREARFAARSSGATLGLAVGSVTWRRHAQTLVPDVRLFEEARARCRQITPA